MGYIDLPQMAKSSRIGKSGGGPGPSGVAEIESLHGWEPRDACDDVVEIVIAMSEI